MMTTRVEDYLETIFEIEMEGQLPSITELAVRLNLRKATVTVAIQKMTEEGLVLHERYGKIALTRSGMSLALQTYRRHSQMTYIFTQLLQIPHEAAERMACAVEHEVTPDIDSRLAGAIKFFTDELGSNPEWYQRLTGALKQPQPMTVPLTMTPAHLPSRVASVNCSEKRRLELAELGVEPGSTITRNSDDDSLVLNVGGRTVELPLEDGVAVWVIPCAGEPIR